MESRAGGPDIVRSGADADASRSDASDWIEWSARLGYTAKGVVYAVIGGLAFQQAIGSGGEISGTRDALRQIASGPFGKVVLGLVTLGLAGYVIWRLVQATLDPEGRWMDSDDDHRWAKRLFFLVSAVAYGFLTYYGATLLFGSGGGGAGGAGAGGGGGESGGGSGGWAARLMTESWGVWLLAAIGAAIVIRGLHQFWKAYTESFREKIQSFELGGGTRKWVLRASRLGLTARGVIFVLIGGSLAYAAFTHDPSEARGTEGALAFLVGNPWLLGAVGAGLVGYAIYQWVKARYRLIGA